VKGRVRRGDANTVDVFGTPPRFAFDFSHLQRRKLRRRLAGICTAARLNAHRFIAAASKRRARVMTFATARV
jgi:hypothetical protein